MGNAHGTLCLEGWSMRAAIWMEMVDPESDEEFEKEIEYRLEEET